MKRRNFFGMLFGLVAGMLSLNKTTKDASTELEVTIKWIDVNDRLPELGSDPSFFLSNFVLVVLENGKITFGRTGCRVEGSMTGIGCHDHRILMPIEWFDVCHGTIRSVIRYWAELPKYPSDVSGDSFRYLTIA